MGREIKRVPVGFDWPLKKVWAGYLMPEWLHEGSCPDCKNGYSREAEVFRDEWYGNAPFDPASTGSSLLTPETPSVRAFAERNVASSPDFYGTGETAIVREATRLCGLWNNQWCHHLSQIDVDALVDGDRLWDFTRDWTAGEGWKPKEPAYRPTASEVNEWSLMGFGHDSLNSGIVVRARCEREGVPYVCSTCKGHASIPKFKGQRKLASKWKSIKPPKGEWWQLWETASEGSPISPAFETPEELAAWINPADPAASFEWVTGAGWAPSMTVVGGVLATSSDYAEGTAKF
jgi:hypothetical protein